MGGDEGARVITHISKGWELSGTEEDPLEDEGRVAGVMITRTQV